MIFERLVVGIYGANCYIIGCEKTKEAVIVDPGGNVDDILKTVNHLNIKVKYIILTHGHGDHIGGLPELKEKLNADVLIHSDDENILMDSNKNLSNLIPMNEVEIKPDKLLEDGDEILFGKYKAHIIHTPGHTPGSICIKINNILLSGDTLFAGSIGRTDLPGGSFEKIISSINNKILVYDDDIEVYPGHGPSTTIGKERLSNPFLV